MVDVSHTPVTAESFDEQGHTAPLGATVILPVSPYDEASALSFDLEESVSGVEEDSSASLENKPWLHLVEEIVEVFNELERNIEGMEPSQRDLAGHMLLRIQEILERSGVETISGETTFDRSRHQLDHSGLPPVPGSVVTETTSPGFAVGQRVLRRARVRSG